MSSDDSIQRLNRVLDFYNQKLDVQKLRLAAQQAVVKKHNEKIEQLNNDLVQSQNRLLAASATIAGRQMGYQFGTFTMAEILEEQKQRELANDELENRKAELRKQISRIESLEKLIERKASVVAYEAGRREQILADERYLNSKPILE